MQEIPVYKERSSHESFLPEQPLSNILRGLYIRVDIAGARYLRKILICRLPVIGDGLNQVAGCHYGQHYLRRILHQENCCVVASKRDAKTIANAREQV